MGEQGWGQEEMGSVWNVVSVRGPWCTWEELPEGLRSVLINVQQPALWEKKDFDI